MSEMPACEQVTQGGLRGPSLGVADIGGDCSVGCQTFCLKCVQRDVVGDGGGQNVGLETLTKEGVNDRLPDEPGVIFVTYVGH